MPWTAEDPRCIRKGGTLHAICLGVPGKELAVRWLAGVTPTRVEMAGMTGAIRS